MMSEARSARIQTSEASTSPASNHMRRLRQRATSPRWVWITSPWPRAQRFRCAHSAPSERGTCIPTSACGSYTVSQPAQQQPPGQLDVLGGHTWVVATNREHAVLAEQPEDAGDGRRRVP